MHRIRLITYHAINTSHALKVVLGQVSKTNGLEEVLLPALLTAIDTNRDVTLFADGAAEAARLVSGGEMGKGVSKVVEFALGE
jgi:hypothetical protein